MILSIFHNFFALVFAGQNTQHPNNCFRWDVSCLVIWSKTKIGLKICLTRQNVISFLLQACHNFFLYRNANDCLTSWNGCDSRGDAWRQKKETEPKLLKILMIRCSKKMFIFGTNAVKYLCYETIVVYSCHQFLQYFILYQL